MDMNIYPEIKHKSATCIVTVAMAMSYAACMPGFIASAAAKSPTVEVNAIAPYVYPGNAEERPAKMVFMPDGGDIPAADRQRTKKYRNIQLPTASRSRPCSMPPTHVRAAWSQWRISPSVPTVRSCCFTPDRKLSTAVRSARHTMCLKSNATFCVRCRGNHKLQQAPLFSPDSRMVAFVADNDIYIKKLDYNSEVRVTTDGAVNSIINGVPDWTYEEEFATCSSMAWAPDNSTLCYVRYDESQVPMFSFPLYSGWCKPDAEYELYPGTFSYKYPVAGEPNSVVSVHSYDVETRKIKELPFADKRIEYMPRIAFGDTAERLMVVTLNRAQNRMELYSANPKSTVVKSLLVEESKAWISGTAYENLAFEADGFVIMSERTGWNHLYRYSYAGQQTAQITSGCYDVTAYYGRDAQGFTYFQSEPLAGNAPEVTGALNRVVYRMDRQGKRPRRSPPVEGWSTARFTPDHDVCRDVAQRRQYPPLSTPWSMPKGRQCARWWIMPPMARATTVRPARSSSPCRPTASPSTVICSSLQASILPGVILQSCGSTAVPVRRRCSTVGQWTGSNMPQKAGFVVVCVDGRGTGGRGTAFRDVVYKQLGRYETADQLAAARYVASLPFVDASRIGICGWSYGGYETLMAVTEADAPFAAGVAIAPVTSWRFYDTVYTERFMLTPGENADGYEESAPMNRAANLNCPLLIMAGTADDNVHLSNTIEFVGALQKEHRYADMLLFPNMNHSINGCDARAMVYGRMIRFFADNM